MNRIIGIFDHISSNSFSLVEALEKIEIKHLVSKNLKDLDGCYKIIIPGIGNMGNLLKQYSLFEMKDFFKNYLKKGGFIYGICLGMQLLFEKSYESNNDHVETLGYFSGIVEPFDLNFLEKMNVGHKKIKLPLEHNSVIRNLFSGKNENDTFYFLHKFYCSNIESGLNSIYSNFEENSYPILIYKKYIRNTVSPRTK